MSRDAYPGLGFFLVVDGRNAGKYFYYSSARKSAVRWEGFSEDTSMARVRPFVVSGGNGQQQQQQGEESAGVSSSRAGTIVVTVLQARVVGTKTIAEPVSIDLGQDVDVPNTETKKFFKQPSLATKAGASRHVRHGVARKVGSVVNKHKPFGAPLDRIRFIYDQELHLKLRGLQFPGDDEKRYISTTPHEDEPDQKKSKTV